ncbi:DUF3747 domain-containing protein [Lyngbya confervoides]|uniref:DUF3747 domain-containing protein n=1 Tax=Lyngbya confervoides BDU141951 TaxID=1574623 RepID=A0ABD4T4A4_9CYAN|nr:DUF3747 domain-containing protein [Lyngbya confervoides]MCM1983552.1 DUF3747 domain-containing protein [Lyngbya confervoides BDU141951]
MNSAAFLPIGVLLATSVVIPIQALKSHAAEFGQTEVEQSRFIAVAVPRSNNFYSLTILEQISDQRPCWQERGSRPTLIDPLLLKFNFAGICGRSADSNGYSIRRNGQDLGLDYRLTLQRRNNEVVLLGVPQRGGSSLELGHTQGLSDSLMKINLRPGWKFAKRNYQGKTLGHIYLAQEGPAIGTLPAPRSGSGVSSSGATSPPSAASLPLPQSLSRRTSAPDLRSSPSSDRSRLYRLYVKPRRSADEALVRSLVPGSFRSSYRGTAVMQAGLFEDKDKARDLQKTLEKRGLQTALVEERGGESDPVTTSERQVASLPSSTSVSRRTSTPMRTPAGSERSRFYRLYVKPRRSADEALVRSLVPGSFRSSYQGTAVMQVGLFEDKDKAQDLQKTLERRGLKTSLVEEQGTIPAARTPASGGAPVSGSVLRVPSSRIPFGNARGEGDVYGRGNGTDPPPPPDPALALAPRIRVMVPTNSTAQQSRVRSLVKDAFRSSYQGRLVMQVGSFVDMNEAQTVIALMQRNGFQPIIDRSN